MYSYDNRGNILSQEYHNYTTGETDTAYYTVEYTYDSTWKDKLVSFEGESISYDSIGNPTTYRDATLTWEKGRQLKSYTYGSNTLNFKYNAEGLRTEKQVGSTTYSYTWSSGLLMQQTDGTNTLNFSYSPDGRPLGVIFNGTNYYYIYNLQGDVIGLYNTAGTVVVQYKYDSWGNLISTTGSLKRTLGKLNPFRYRGYIYDEEIWLYWLRSRYYDPEVGRFLNTDRLIDNRGIATQNQFSYCTNNPINNIDVNGAMTVGLFINGNITLGVGASISIGFVIDDKGNFDIQYSYSLPKSENTAHMGAFDIGGGLALQITKAETVYDLYGVATCFGASGGDGVYVGMDLITFSEITDLSEDFDGVQFCVGYGFGVDVHITQTYTRSLLDEPQKLTINQVNKYTLMEKRMHGEVV